ncbi:hypothetical protein ASD66_13805 [Nocardioides sp. Root151]|nr:hypothetical protein ASD66_13805 [Nocardioides sp. Root151]
MLRSVRNVAVTVTLTVLAALLLSPATQAQAAAAADPLAGAPRVNQCFNVQLSAANSSASLPRGPVSCATKHTLKVIARAAVPSDIPLDGSNARFRNFVSSKCRPAIKLVLGNNTIRYAESAYDNWIFIPTAAQRAAGSHWVICTLGVQGGVTTLATSTTGRLTKVTTTLPQRLRMCGTRYAQRVNCAQPHMFHVAKSKLVYSAYSYTRASRISSSFCPRYVGTGSYMWLGRGLGPNSFVLTCLRR